jgi:DNA-binding transcriptional ArsR family regulator
MTRDRHETALPVEFQILELFQASGCVVLGPTDVERLTGVSKGSLSAKLRALADAGYLKAVGGGKYQPGPRMMTLALGYLGLVLGQIDETRKLLDVNLAEIRTAMQAMGSVIPGAGEAGPKRRSTAENAETAEKGTD